MEEVYICHIKGLGHDSYGLEKVLWLTRSQVDKIVALRNDVEKSSKLVGVGSLIFSPKDVAYIEKCRKEPIDAPKYFRERVREEQKMMGDTLTIKLEEGKKIDECEFRTAGPKLLIEESTDTMADYRYRRQHFIDRHINESRGYDSESASECAE